VALADKVALLADGAIVALGTHAELLRTQPRYRHLMSGVAGEGDGAGESDSAGEKVAG
jgi:ATP-binding cassette subfamily B protein